MNHHLIRSSYVLVNTNLFYELGRSGARYIIGGENITVKQLLTLFAEAGGATPPRFELPSSLMSIAAALGIAPYEVWGRCYRLFGLGTSLLNLWMNAPLVNLKWQRTG